MKSTLSILMLMLFATIAQANHGWGPSWGDRATESFRATCQVEYEDNYEIRANCKDLRGNLVYNVYYRSGCTTDIANVAGRIVCQPGGSTGALPSGSYQASCNTCGVSGSILQCFCKDIRGKYNVTSIYVGNCHRGIDNVNGQLTCH